MALLCLVFASAAAAATVEGEVSAEDGGAPLEGVLVCAWDAEEEFSELEEELCEPTDADGLYEITGLPAGQYVVEFWPGYKHLPYFGEYWDDREFFSTADEIELGSLQTADEIDAELEASGVIEGTVVAEQGGEPLQYVEVCAYSKSGGRCAWTDEEGEYAIGELAADDYTVEFWDLEGTYMSQWYDNHDHPEEADEIEVEPGEPSDEIDATMRPGGRIQGKVTVAATGAGIEEMLVCAIENSERLAECGFTGPQGNYTLYALSGGAYKVAFSIDLSEWFTGEADEPDGYDTQYYDGQSTLAAASPVTVVPPGTVAGINARFGPPPAPPPVAPVSGVAKKKKPAAKACRKGFKKRKVKGKKRCVKIHKGKKGGEKKSGRGAKGRALSRFGAVRIQP